MSPECVSSVWKVWCHLLAFSEKMLEFEEMQSSVIGSAAVGSVAWTWRRRHKLLFVEGMVDFARRMSRCFHSDLASCPSFPFSEMITSSVLSVSLAFGNIGYFSYSLVFVNESELFLCISGTESLWVV